MTIEEKQLLLKDLCARLPYGVMVENVLNHETFDLSKYLHCLPAALENFKPYLRPMSSMTEEEKHECRLYCGYTPYYEEEDCGERYLTESDMPDYIDFLYEHHLDFRGLIPMGIALEAKEGMYETLA